MTTIRTHRSPRPSAAVAGADLRAALGPGLQFGGPTDRLLATVQPSRRG